MSKVLLDFFYQVRAQGVSATTHNWLALLQALAKGVHDHSLDGFYWVARAVLCSDERQYDGFDRAFSSTFRGKVQADVQELLSQVDEWLRDPKLLQNLDPALREALASLDLQTLREQLAQRLAEQKERHEGGSRWIGTGGTSPFGQGGYHPSGVRMGGQGGSRSALAVADQRRFRAYDQHLTLDTRQIASALRRLRELGRQGLAEELDLDATVFATAKAAGELEVVWRPPRENRLRVILLLDVGGSMDPHAKVVSQLFSAAVQGGDFRELRTYYFHNCPYARLYRSAEFDQAIDYRELLHLSAQEWLLIFVGDAWMHPGELDVMSGNFWDPEPGPSGREVVARLSEHFVGAAWLNPENERIWNSPTIAVLRELVPMYHLSLAGLQDMAKGIRRPFTAMRRQAIATALRR